MAHTLDTNIDYPNGTTNSSADPVTTTFTCGATATVLVVGVWQAGTAARTGGDPTFDSQTMTQAGTQQVGVEASCEIWYLLNPSKTAGATLNVPNSGTVATHLWIASFISATGYSAFDAADGTGPVTGTNPTANITVGAVGAVKVAQIASGAQTWNPSGQTGVALINRDLGAFGGSMQYHVATATGSQAMAWTFGTSDDYGIGIVSIKEGSAPTNLVVQEAASVTALEAVTLAQTYNVSGADTASVTNVENVVLTQLHQLTVQEAASITDLEAVVLTREFNLSVDDAASLTDVESVVLAGSSIDLVVADASSITSLDGIAYFPQIFTPSADVLDGNWTNQAGSATDLFESVNELSPSDTDFIQSEQNPANSPCVLRLASGVDPQSSSGHVLSYRYFKDAAGEATQDLVVQLRQGYVSEGAPGTLIAEWTHTNISDTPTTAAQTLTTGQADAITNYADLFVRLVGV